MTDRFFAEPAAHPRLLEPGATTALATGWAERGAARIDDALEPGLVARIAAVAPQLPVTPHMDAAGREVTWTSRIEMPEVTGLNYPSCLYRAVRFARDDLPPLVRAITGAPLAVEAPFEIRVCALKMGSYIDAGAGGVEAFLWLDAPEWPDEWGGRVELLDDSGAVVTALAPRAGALDLVPSERYRITLVERDVACVALRYSLAAAPEGA